MTRPSPRRPAPPTPEELLRAGRATRRLVVAGFGGIAAALAGLTIGIPLMFPDAQPPPRFSNRRIVPPLLRARLELRHPQGRDSRQRGTPPGDLAAEEALFALVRADMRFLGEPEEGPPPHEMLQLWSYLADDIWYSAWDRVAVVAPGGAPDARLLAAQGDTVWVWADQLVAVGPGPFGRMADQRELARLNPELDLDGPGLRGRLSLGEALLLDNAWAFDPATRIARPRAVFQAGGPPPLQPAAPAAGPVLAREGRLGSTWFGLLPEGMAIGGSVAAQDDAGGFLPALAEPIGGRLWRGRVRDRPPGAGGSAGTSPAATDVLDGAQPVQGLDPIPSGGLVMAGPGRLLGLDGPPSLLLAQVGREPGLRESLRRLRLDGATLWETALPTTEQLNAAFVEPGRLWLLAHPGGLSQDIHAIALDDGRILRTRHI